MLTQNRQFQWYHQPSYIYPVVPAYGATLLKKNQFGVCWYDGIASGQQPEAFFTYLKQHQPDLIVMETKTPVIRLHWQIVRRIKELLPESRVALMGDHVTALPQETFAACPVDFVITGGDFDFEMLALARHLRDGKALSANIFARQGETIVAGSAVEDRDLNTLPLIDRRLTMAHQYGEKWKKRLPFFYTMVGRDCHWGKCSFCAWTTLYPQYRTRTAESLLEEIAYLVRDHGAREIFDDTGSFPTGEWLVTFCEEMIRRGLHRKVLFSCNKRFDRTDRKIYSLMKRAGFRKLKMGLESANQHTLDRLHKGICVDDIRAGCQEASKAGLDVHLTVMVGFPWETRLDVQATIKLAQSLMAKGHAEMLQATVAVPYPGTPLHDYAVKEGVMRFDPQEYERYDMTEPAFEVQGMSPEEVVRSCARLYRSFFHPRFMLRQALRVRSLEDLSYAARGVKAITGHIRDFLAMRQ